MSGFRWMGKCGSMRGWGRTIEGRVVKASAGSVKTKIPLLPSLTLGTVLGMTVGMADARGSARNDSCRLGKGT
jgi:hypothetical protein